MIFLAVVFVIAIIVIIRSSIVGWQLIATKMKNIKWLDLWRREVKIGNRVWEFRIMFAFCVCARLRFIESATYIHIRIRIRIHMRCISKLAPWVTEYFGYFNGFFWCVQREVCVNVFFAFFQFLLVFGFFFLIFPMQASAEKNERGRKIRNDTLTRAHSHIERMV